MTELNISKLIGIINYRAQLNLLKNQVDNISLGV